MEAQPLGESDQLFGLLHAPHLSAAALNDLVRGIESPIPAATCPRPLYHLAPHPSSASILPTLLTAPRAFWAFSWRLDPSSVWPRIFCKQSGRVTEILHSPEILRCCGPCPDLPNVPFRIHRAPKKTLGKVMRPTSCQRLSKSYYLLLRASLSPFIRWS